MIEPRVTYASAAEDETLGVMAVRFAAEHGLLLDEWQAMALHDALRRVDGRWASIEVAAVVPRQNGKGGLIEARELAGIFLAGEQLIIHSAHQFDTSMEAFLRMEEILEESGLTDQLKNRSGVSRSHGSEGFMFKTGQRIRYRTRTKGGGRGFSCDCLMLDEAMFLPEFTFGALLPTLSARPDPQVWYTGSAVDQLVHEHGIVLARVRERALKREGRLAYFEWSLEQENPDLVDDDLAQDRSAWAQANPALGIRVSEEMVEMERGAMDPRTFAVERLGVGDWPPTSAAAAVDLEKWANLTDLKSRIEGPIMFAFDVKGDRSATTIAAAGRRPDGLIHIEIIDRRRGTQWVPDRIAELVQKHQAGGVFCDAYGPGSSLLQALEGIDVTELSSREIGQACGLFHDTVEQDGLRHLGTPELIAALRGAQKRSLGDAWAWSRKNSAVDISPLVAVTVAMWGVQVGKPVEIFASSW